MRPLEDDVVTLPLAGFARRVHQRRLPRVDRADGAVGIGRVPIAVEDLELVPLHAPDAAVAAILYGLGRRIGRDELEVTLDVAEAFFAVHRIFALVIAARYRARGHVPAATRRRLRPPRTAHRPTPHH